MNPNNNHQATNPVGRFMVAAGAVIELAGTGKILLLRRSDSQDWHPGEWEINYGRIAQHEDPEQGLRRELLEETGLADVSIKDQLSVWHMYRGETSAENDLIGITYLCTTSQQTITLSAEHSEYAWVTADTALSLIKIEGIARDVKLYLQSKQRQPIRVGSDVIGVGAGAVILNEKQEILLSLRGPAAKNEVGKWEIPGGAVEFGESLESALKREVFEEIGVQIEVVRLLHICNHILPDEHQHWVAPSYICKIVSGEPYIKEPDKSVELRWVSLSEASELPLAVATANDVKELLRQSLLPHS